MTDRMSKRVGRMPQERGLYPRMRVREQLLYLGQLCGRRIGEGAGSSTPGWSGSGWLTGPGTASTACRTETSSVSS
jgi:hypothetical protein